ncbi:MAG: hypothetical protein COT85_07035 [Chlamydiae bacterium CG10_big_fil_rev_8_21_14_0_10_42_34]|nr:MAG: hypothetical protein COT85_07035 [Chlamydiae bacterium CG10_big_fil_rev_8_21_14_0_10_42_34]
MTSITTQLKSALQTGFKKLGYQIRKHYEACDDIGREYEDLPDSPFPRFTLKKAPPTPWSGNDVKFIVDNGKTKLEEVVYYSHLSLLKMCKDFSFKTVLDIGSHERRVTRIFEHIGKKVTTIEVAPGYEADIKADYLYHQFTTQFDAIWCSQTYEHQRNPGLFLDKLFDDLSDGGVLALTVPFQLDHYVLFGHLNITSPLMLIYHLVCAGFDCSDICMKCYNGSIAVILKKKYNGIKRGLSFGSLPLLNSTKSAAKELLGDELFAQMKQSFPPCLADEVERNILTSHIKSINWSDPI